MYDAGRERHLCLLGMPAKAGHAARIKAGATLFISFRMLTERPDSAIGPTGEKRLLMHLLPPPPASPLRGKQSNPTLDKVDNQ